MTEDEARQVELVRAVELEDRESGLLTPEDRDQAEAFARSRGADVGNRRGAQAYVAARADFAGARLATRHPGIAGLVRRSRWPAWLGWAVPALALVAGFVGNEFGTSKRLDLLALPLIGTVAWNLFVYAWLAGAMFARRKRAANAPLYRLLMRIRGFGAGKGGHGGPLERAGAAFEKRWASASAPLSAARIERTMHFAAALFACGLIAGIYLRALVIEYRAGWESTFLGPGAVHALLTAMLGPASLATGVPLPGIEGVAAMRWTGPESGGVNAAPWIYLYTATVVGLVVLPRLLLGLWQGAKAMRLARRFPVAGREDFYVRRLLRSAGGSPGRVRITPYAYQPGEETKRRLAEAFRGALGEGADIRFDEPVAYGEEDRWLAQHSGHRDDDYHILLFTLSATPEEENHGAIAAALARRMASEGNGTMLGALVDETPFRAHFAGQQGLDERIRQRLSGWKRALATAGVAPIGADLSLLDRSLAERLESGLMSDGAMRG